LNPFLAHMNLFSEFEYSMYMLYCVNSSSIPIS